MAQPQPPNAAPIGAPAGVGPAIPGGPTTYLARYAALPDVLHGSYAALYTPFLATSNLDEDDLFDRVLNTSDIVPKAYLGLLRIATGRYRSLLVHRVQRFPTHPVTTTQWDSMAFGFAGDVLPGNHIDVVEFPNEAFKLQGEQTVSTTDQITAQYAPAGQDRDHLLLAPADGAADTDKIQARTFVQVPHQFIGLLLGQNLSPRELWEQLGGAIRASGHDADCKVLLDWLRGALTLRRDPDDPANALSPSVCAGDAGRVCAPVAADAHLQHMRWSTLVGDLPALDPTRLSPPDQMMALIAALRQDRAVERAQDAASRAAAQAPKLPSETFPLVTPIWMKLAGSANERELPMIYHQWAKGTKGERRVAFARLLEQRAAEAGAATTLVPVVTKELYETALYGKVATAVHETDDLTLGITPFTCGYFPDLQGGEVAARAQRYDLMMQGLSAPTLQEQDTFSTKEVALPTTTYQAGLQLHGCSLVFDVIMGAQAPLATRYRDFCSREWPVLESVLHLAGTYDPDIQTNVLPAILRWIQVNLATYFRALLGGRPTALPPFEYLVTLVEQRAFNLLPPIPWKYRTPTPVALSVGGSGLSAGGTSVTSGLTEDQTRAGTAASGGTGRGGAMVQNARLNSDWKRALEASGKRLAELKSHAPTFQLQGRNVEACLSYHIRGTCFENCARAVTHKSLSAAEKNQLGAFVRDHLQAGGTTGGATTAPPAAAPTAPAAPPAGQAPAPR